MAARPPPLSAYVQLTPSPLFSHLNAQPRHYARGVICEYDLLTCTWDPHWLVTNLSNHVYDKASLVERCSPVHIRVTSSLLLLFTHNFDVFWPKGLKCLLCYILAFTWYCPSKNITATFLDQLFPCKSTPAKGGRFSCGFFRNCRDSIALVYDGSFNYQTQCFCIQLSNLKYYKRLRQGRSAAKVPAHCLGWIDPWRLHDPLEHWTAFRKTSGAVFAPEEAFPSSWLVISDKPYP